jgi:hypothetical protein
VCVARVGSVRQAISGAICLRRPRLRDLNG